MRDDHLERQACTLRRVSTAQFNQDADLPYGCRVEHVHAAMNDFLEFLEFINTQLHSREIPRFECLLMPANFSSTVGEFMGAAIPRHCDGLVRNTYHNGHPDLLPTGMYQNDSVLHADEGIEIKASRYMKGWQGHNPEDVWLMVFVFEASRAADASKGIPPTPFRFIKVVGARLTKSDWNISGRSATSRRTITASVTSSGFDKMEANWIYRGSD